MESDTAKQQKKQQYEWLKKYQWKKGQSGNPDGAKKGKKVKTRVAEMLMDMTDEEMKAFLQEINPEIVWRMAEGNPSTDTTLKGDENNPLVIKQVNYGDNHSTQVSTEELPTQSPQGS